MAEVQFEEEKSGYTPTAAAGEKSSFVRAVLATGIVSTEKEAEYVLLGLVVVLLIIAAIIPFISSKSSPAPLPPGTKVIKIPGIPPRLSSPGVGR